MALDVGEMFDVATVVEPFAKKILTHGAKDFCLCEPNVYLGTLHRYVCLVGTFGSSTWLRASKHGFDDPNGVEQW